MKFTVTAAKYHVLEGLHLADVDGVWYPTDTKTSMIEAGFVLFPMQPPTCPYRVEIPEDLIGGVSAIHGTDDPKAVDLARRANEGEFSAAAADGWVSVPV